MCGILGFIGTKKINKSRIKRGCDAMLHRGPDANGIFAYDKKGLNIILGHTRLSIIDVDSRSDQPFYYDNSILIFNGEIYNFMKIKNELIDLGHSFKTSSDTEVLSHSLRQWGSRALNKLEGMWSFAWFDKTTDEIIISRDRFGEKPLYLWKNQEGLFFSSEIHALKKTVGLSPSINLPQVQRFLVNGYKSLHKHQDTFFSEIFELSKGKYAIINKNLKIIEKSYWKPKLKEDKNLTFDDCTVLVRETLIKTVKKQLNSDVPLAFCMSGGVDSNTLMAIAKNYFNYDVHGFTVDSSDPKYSEKKIVDLTIKNLKIKNTFIKPDKKDFLKNLKSLIANRASPVYTIANYCHSELMRSISSKGYKVCIGGAGADELFSGYYDHHLFYLRQIKKNKNLFNTSLKNWKENILKITRNPFLKDYKLFLNQKKPRDHIFLNNEIFSSYLKKNWNEKFSEITFTKDELRNRMLNEIFHETVPAILHEEDLNAMFYSIENRTPFLDNKLFEVCSLIPTRYLINNGAAKSILRESMKGIVIDKVLKNTKKIGFNASIHELLNLDDKKIKSQVLDDSKIFEIVDRNKIEQLLKIKKMSNSYSKFLFSFISTKLFIDTV
tara:strand:- start:1056 stop:2879 length:1824 start_codon:yes stop_codon:yes gene_type:complete